MKMLRRLPDDPGEVTQRLTTYRKGDDEYIVLESAGGRFIFFDEGGADNSLVAGVHDVLQQEDLQDSIQSQASCAFYSQRQGNENAAGILMPDMQTVSSDEHTVIHHAVPANCRSSAND